MTGPYDTFLSQTPTQCLFLPQFLRSGNGDGMLQPSSSSQDTAIIAFGGAPDSDLFGMELALGPNTQYSQLSG